MQRGKSVKVKEVIESLCKLLSALGVDSVPGIDTFRRAKFNKRDAVEELWRLLYSLLSKAVQWECECPAAHQHDVGAQTRLVSGALWHCGYGASWLAGTRSEEVGSRDLLLALGWAMASGSLLETLLGEQAVGLETPSTLPPVLVRTPVGRLAPGIGEGAGECARGLAVAGDWERDLRRLQWEQGKLRLLRRSLQTAQAERARLLHQVLSSTSEPSVTHPATGYTGQSKELARLRTDIQLLEIYLDWKRMEPLFWCWMFFAAARGPRSDKDAEPRPFQEELSKPSTVTLTHSELEDSVIDAELTEGPLPSHRGAVATASAVVKGPRCQGDGGRRGTGALSEMLLMQVRLKARWAEQRGHALPRDRKRAEDVVSGSEGAKIRERVELRLRDLTEAYVPQRASWRHGRLRLLEPPTRRPRGPAKHSPTEVRASRLIEELREEEAGLRQEVERLRRGQREELQELAGRLEGVVLIPPPKR